MLTKVVFQIVLASGQTTSLTYIVCTIDAVMIYSLLKFIIYKKKQSHDNYGGGIHMYASCWL